MKKEHCPWSAVASGRRTQVRSTVIVAGLHASVYVEGKLSDFWCRPSLSHYRETCFRDPRKQLP